MVVYFNGNYLPPAQVNISPFDRGFNFADGVYEALRSYKGKLFRFESHMRRLKYSLSEINIQFNNLDELYKISLSLAEMNNILPGDFSVYMQITRGYQFPRQHCYGDNIKPTVFVSVSELKDTASQLKDGVKIIVDEDKRWSRCDIKSISLLPSVIANKRADDSGAYEAIFHRNDLITEGSHTNFFAVKGGVIYTAPLSAFILEGITREVILELCVQNNIKVVTKSPRVSELKNFEEFFVSGTTTEITPVIMIDDWLVGNGKPGKTTRLIQKLFRDYVNS